MWVMEDVGKIPAEMEMWCERNSIHPLVRPLFAKAKISSVHAAEKFLFSRLSDATPSTAFGEQVHRAVERIVRAVNRKERIIIFGDYDVDGTCGTALLMEVLGHFRKEKGFFLDFVVPDRFEEGYGLGDRVLVRLLEKKPDLVITVDCGIKSAKQIRTLKGLGVDVIVTDHHQPGDELPDAAVAIVHPKVCNYPEENICGCAVAYQLARAMWQTKGLAVPEWVEYGTIDLVALGTICDIMPLVGDNRIYVREGLRVLNAGRRTAIAAMKKRFGWTKIDRNIVGFQIGPCINANGRVEKADIAVRMLLSRDMRECMEYVKVVAERNEFRKELQSKVVEEGLLQIPDQPYKNIIVIKGDNFHEGVVGIAAGNIASRYKKPTFVLHDGGEHVGGSARSIPGIDLYGSLKKFEHLLHTWGGHSAAVGLKLRKADMDTFFRLVDEDLEKYGQEVWDAKPKYFGEIPDGGCLSDEFFYGLELFEPFGNGFPAPVWKIVGCVVDERNARKNSKIGKIEVFGKTFNFAMWENAEKSFWSRDQVYYGTWDRHPRFGIQFTAMDAEPPNRSAPICVNL